MFLNDLNRFVSEARGKKTIKIWGLSDERKKEKVEVELLYDAGVFIVHRPLPLNINIKPKGYVVSNRDGYKIASFNKLKDAKSFVEDLLIIAFKYNYKDTYHYDRGFADALKDLMMKYNK